MKKIYIFIFSIFFISNVQAQTAKELIKKMQASIQQLKTIHFEMDKNHYSIINNKQQFKMKADIVFDTNAAHRPLIQKLNCLNTEIYKNENKISKKLFSPNKLVTIKENTGEIFIEFIDKEDFNDKLTDFQMEVFPFFDASANSYLDSMFNPNFISNFIDMDNISFEITTDTACLSGDCYLVNISAPSLFGIEVPNDTNDDSTKIIEFKKEINSIWINKKSYFPERYRRALTIYNDSLGECNDFRFMKIEKNIKMQDTSFELKKNLYSSYRIDELTHKGIFTTQEAFIKAPNIKGVTAKGDSIHLYQNKAKLYLIDFWFTNCPTCINAKVFIEKEIIPNYSNSEIMVIGVNPIDKSFAAVEKALKEETPVYPYILNKEAAKDYHLSAYPGIYLLNSRFEVIRSYNSFSERVQQELTELIHQHLK